jgi:hypothetical protein
MLSLISKIALLQWFEQRFEPLKENAPDLVKTSRRKLRSLMF